MEAQQIVIPSILRVFDKAHTECQSIADASDGTEKANTARLFAELLHLNELELSDVLLQSTRAESRDAQRSRLHATRGQLQTELRHLTADSAEAVADLSAEMAARRHLLEKRKEELRCLRQALETGRQQCEQKLASANVSWEQRMSELRLEENSISTQKHEHLQSGKLEELMLETGIEAEVENVKELEDALSSYIRDTYHSTLIEVYNKKISTRQLNKSETAQIAELKQELEQLLTARQEFEKGETEKERERLEQKKKLDTGATVFQTLYRAYSCRAQYRDLKTGKKKTKRKGGKGKKGKGKKKK